MSPTAAQVNTGSIEAFWEIAEVLKQDKTPSEEAWKTFFNLPGNQLAIKSYANQDKLKDTIKRSLQLVYMPSNRERLQYARIDHFVENIIYTRDHEEAIKEYLAFVKEGTVVDSMYQLAYQFLPPKRQKKVKGLKVYYIGPLTHDSKAFDKTVFINVAMEVRLFPKHTAFVGAHELHHILVGRATPWELSRPEQFKYFDVAQTVHRLMREGVADLIDKKYWLVQQDTFHRPLVEKGLQDADSMIVNLNAELERLQRQTGTEPQLRGLISRGGHVPGHYMALVIERNGYLPELIKNIHNPFVFIYLYNKAAEKDAQKPPLFSRTAMLFLRYMDSLY